MATAEVIRDAPSMPLLPIDETVKLPESVRRAAALAESFYQKPSEPKPEPAPELEPVAVVPESEPAPEPAPPEPAPPEQHAQDIVTPSKDELKGDSWAGRYNSMKGRYEALQRTLGGLQETVSQLGDENVRLQNTLQGMQQQPRNEPQPMPAVSFTDKDVENFGPEILDVIKRGALATVAPEIEKLKGENQALRQRQQMTAQQSAAQQLTQAVPNWRQVNSSDEFKAWASLRSLYSETGKSRGQVLVDAHTAANAPVMIGIFKDFERESIATGNVPALQPAPVQAPPLRQAAIPLETLAAPGRARPATGDSPAMPADKPTFTRAQITRFYDGVRRNVYAGRETEKARQENEIFLAQREGRVR